MTKNGKILAIMPISIGGRLTASSLIDGFVQNGFEVVIYDELEEEKSPAQSKAKKSALINQISGNYKYITGYDFSPIKFKTDNSLNLPVVAYFSDDIRQKTAGEEYQKYYKYIKNDDIFVFYWDRILTQKENQKLQIQNPNKSIFYQPHFVNCEIYDDFMPPQNDILFMGRLDTTLRLETYLGLYKKLNNYPESAKKINFQWFAIEKHYKSALERCETQIDKNIIKSTYQGFIDNEKAMARAINDSKIIYNINAQGISSFNYRTIQTLACKRLIISDERAELDLFNNIIPTYKNIDDLAQKIKFYLENKEEYEKITKTSYDLIRKNHNSFVCVKNILNKINFKEF